MENQHYYLFDEEGRITSYSITEEVYLALKDRGVNLVKGKANADTQYVENGRLLPRPSMGVEVNGLNIYKVPLGAMVYVEGIPYIVEDGIVELEFNQPGRYQVRIVKWPYLDEEIYIENPAL